MKKLNINFYYLFCQIILFYYILFYLINILFYFISLTINK